MNDSDKTCYRLGFVVTLVGSTKENACLIYFWVSLFLVAFLCHHIREIFPNFGEIPFPLEKDTRKHIISKNKNMLFKMFCMKSEAVM